MTERSSLPPTAAAGSIDLRADRSRKAALAAARLILIEEGWEGITHLRVAQRSGLGRATIWRHWPKVSDLLRDALADQIPVLTAATTDSFRDDLVRQLHLVSRMLTRGGYGRVLAALIDRAEWDEEIHRIKVDMVSDGFGVIRHRLRRAAEQGEIASDIDVSRALSQLTGPIVYRRLLSAERLTNSFIAGIVDDFLAIHPEPECE